TVARALSAAGYRTTGNRGANPFTKDTLAEVLTNRFYWGDLPVFEEVKGEDGAVRKIQVGWALGEHAPLEGFDDALWGRVQAVRQRNRTRVGEAAPARTYALSGLCVCQVCGGTIRVQKSYQGRVRLLCRNRNENRAACDSQLTY